MIANAMNRKNSVLGHSFRNFDQTIVKVKVGKGESSEYFSIHKELLCRCSGYFDSFFLQQQRSPYENQEPSFDLEDISPDTFDAFLIWLYTGQVPHHLIEGKKEEQLATKGTSGADGVNGTTVADANHEENGVDTLAWGINLNDDEEKKESQETGDTTSTSSEKPADEAETAQTPTPAPARGSGTEKPEIPKETICPCCSRPYKWRSLEGFLERRFINLYIFAQRYDIPSLRRAVMIAWQTNDEILQSIPDHSNVIAAYEGLPADSPLCRYFLDMYSVFWNPDRDDERTNPLRSQLPQAFLYELATTLARGERPKVEQEWCEFHEHEEDEEKKACRAELMKDPVGARALKRIRDSRSWKGALLKKGGTRSGQLSESNVNQRLLLQAAFQAMPSMPFRSKKNMGSPIVSTIIGSTLQKVR